MYSTYPIRKMRTIPVNNDYATKPIYNNSNNVNILVIS